MKKVINYEDKPKEDTVKVDKAIESKRAEMDKLRQSMQPKKTPVKSLPFNQEDMEMQKADDNLFLKHGFRQHHLMVLANEY